MNSDIETIRSEIDAVLSSAGRSTLPRRFALLGAVSQAEQLERLGSSQDTRRLAAALGFALEDAEDRNAPTDIEIYRAKLLAVLCDVADLGDEDAAVAVNISALHLPPHVLGLARGWHHIRQTGAAAGG